MRPRPTSSRVLLLVAGLAALVGLSGCGTAGSEITGPNPTPSAAALSQVGPSGAAPSNGSARPFPADALVDYQLGGAYDPPAGVGIVARDSTEQPASGVYSICYVNGFQTQPGEGGRWDGVAADLVLRDASGEPVIDPGWPDEMILDTSTPDKRGRIAAILGEDIARCAETGFDAVEIDNLDTFSRVDGLTLDDNTALAALYAEQAHGLGLLIGQKNSAEYAPALREGVGFDFAVAEECVSFDECSAYTDVYGGAVIDVEYADDPTITLDEVCADPSRPPATVFRDRDLVTPGSPDYVFAHC